MLNDKQDNITKGRGAQYNPQNKFEEQSYIRAFAEGIDDWEQAVIKTKYIKQSCTNLLNEVNFVDIPMVWSVNPYQGCEHGCIYCYARPTHEHLGYSAGLDFESNIIVKQNAPDKLRAAFDKASWQPAPISLSGNTDPYQPAERKYKITRELLKICLQYKNPVGIITKNALILRDIDLLQELASHKLVQVFTSVTGTDEKLRQKLEPRTSTYSDRFKIIEILSKQNIPTGIMNAPIIPGINDAEIHTVLQQAAAAGAQWAGYNLVKLVGPVQELFKDWLYKTFPDRADKVWNNISAWHQPSGTMDYLPSKDVDATANIILQQFNLYTKKYNLNTQPLQLDVTKFVRPGKGGQLSLFD